MSNISFDKKEHGEFGCILFFAAGLHNQKLQSTEVKALDEGQV
jgi:hypothetical protein